jgi:uncharacterized protein
MTLALKPERFHLNDFRSQPASVCGKAMVVDQSGAAFWPAQRALIVSDLHLERVPAHVARGRYDTRQTLLRLVEVIDLYEPEMVIALGDSFGDADAMPPMRPEDLEIISLMQEDRRWIWVTGKDKGNSVVPSGFGGEALCELTLDGITIRREPWPARTTHEIAGGMAPAARVSIYGTSLRRPCFVSNGLRLVIPAFGAYSGGLNVLDDAFRLRFGDRGLAIWMLGDEGVYPIAARLLRRE